MNSPLKQNTTDLQELLEVVNNLPEFLDTTDATATVNDILSGKTAYANGNIKIGTMANNGDVSTTFDGINTKSVSIPAGYTSGGTIGLDDSIDNAVTDALNALVEKGIEVPDGSKIDSLAGLISGIDIGQNYVTGTITPTSNILSQYNGYTITHNLGRKPNIIVFWCSNYVTKASGALDILFDAGLRSDCFEEPNTLTCTQCTRQDVYSYAHSNASIAGTSMSGQHIAKATETVFKTMGRLTAGNTYRYIVC